MSNALLVAERGSSIIITFNRPEIRSPLSIRVVEELSGHVSGIADRSDLEQLIFTGVGNVFASGADLREIAHVTGHDAAEFALMGQSLMRRIAELTVRTIAAVNGICFGGALDLALACDRRIASPNALFSHPGANLGIMTGWGGTQRLPRLIGEAKALEMFFLAGHIAADEALKIGLVHEIAEDVVEAALAN